MCVITSCENTSLPAFEGLEQLGLLDARIDVPGVGEVAALNTHLYHKQTETG